jgi:hypothetical protein
LGGNDSVTVGLYDADLTTIADTVLVDKMALFLIGKVRYGDIWGNEYETEFAYWLRDTSATEAGNTVSGVVIKPRKMSRATGSLRTFCRTKKAKPKGKKAA